MGKTSGNKTARSDMNPIVTGKPLITLKSVDSTNDFATRLLRQENVPEGTVILADHQTQGKGHGGNQWTSEPGSNLLFSLILKPDFLLAERQFFLSMSISNALFDFISGIAQPVHLKWPNDILLQKGKVAGILIENALLNQHMLTSVVGIGMNINQQVFPSGLPNPTSLAIVTGKNFDLRDIFDRLCKMLDIHLNRLYLEAYGEIKSHYLNHLWKMNEWSAFTESHGTFEGRITDVADSGELIVEDRAGKLRRYGFKEVTLD
jgi:BirA family biotin operon repressor/biotin-[acetyl-CoA-carboxylase] ligase